VKKLFFLCTFLIVYFTLYPRTLVPWHEHSQILMGIQPPAGRGEYLDIVVNVCFYAPLGALGVLAWWRGSSTPGRWLALAAFGAALSCTLETIQAWVPTRDSSVLDILTNTIGTIVGARVGLMLAGHVPSGSGWRPSSFRPMPLVLVAAWLLSQWFPFLPIMRVPRFLGSWHILMQVSALRWVDVADAFVAALLVGRLLRELPTRRAAGWAVAGAGLVLPARLFFIVGASPWPLAVAFAAGLTLSWHVGARYRAEARVLAVVAIALLVARELDPFQFNAPGPFFWIPFTGFLGATSDVAIRVTAGKFFLYGATVWILREAGASLAIAAAGVGGLLLGGEWVQRYLPGRIAESTDPLLAVLAACVIAWVGDRPGAARKP